MDDSKPSVLVATDIPGVTFTLPAGAKQLTAEAVAEMKARAVQVYTGLQEVYRQSVEGDEPIITSAGER